MTGYNIHKVIEYLPHRYPFLLIDKIINIERNVIAQAVKNVSYNESFFLGHFPTQPVMPGVLLVEVMAQTSALCVIEPEKSCITPVYLTSIERAKFKKMVVPGDVLLCTSRCIKKRMSLFVFESSILVDNIQVASAVIGATRAEA